MPLARPKVHWESENINTTDSLQEQWGETGKEGERERSGNPGELSLPRSLHSVQEVVEMIVDSLSNPVCSPCSGLGTMPSPGVIREGFTVRNTWSPHLPIRGVFYPFLSQLPALSSVSENLVS